MWEWWNSEHQHFYLPLSRDFDKVYAKESVTASDCKQQDKEVHPSALLSHFAPSTGMKIWEEILILLEFIKWAFHPFGDYEQEIKFSFIINRNCWYSTHIHTSPPPKILHFRKKHNLVFNLFRHLILISKSSYFFFSELPSSQFDSLVIHHFNSCWQISEEL